MRPRECRGEGRASVHRLASVKGAILAKFDPAGFIRDVRQEVARVTWPTRKETLVTTGLVLALSALAALFFMLVDWIISGAMRLLFGLGG
jgi:preprotein translocase subunit SecE